MTLELAKLFLQLGVAGAALFLVYHLINKVFIYLGARNAGDTKVDKLCDKIDKLIDVINKTSAKTNELVALNNQMQGILKNGLDIQFNCVGDIQQKVDKIDLRTSKCLEG